MNTITKFRNIHKGATIIVLGSGTSLDFYNNFNFSDIKTIGVNMMSELIPCDYVILHHHSILKRVQEKGNYKHLFVSLHDICLNSNEIVPDSDDYFIYNHCNQTFGATNFMPFDERFRKVYPNCILTGGNTVINAIGLAVYMGAKNILLAGCDGGGINGRSNVKDYYQEDKLTVKKQIRHSVSSLAMNMQIRCELQKIGVNLMSLSPFLDFDLEGNKFSSFKDEDKDEYFRNMYEKYKIREC